MATPVSEIMAWYDYWGQEKDQEDMPPLIRYHFRMMARRNRDQQGR